MPREPLPPKKCGWRRCDAVLPDRRNRWCDEHREPGAALMRSERNARYNDSRSALAAHALSPDVLADGGVLLHGPLADRLAAAVARLDDAVTEYDRCQKALVGFTADLAGQREGWAELKAERLAWLSMAVTGLRHAARDAADALGPVLDARGETDPQG